MNGLSVSGEKADQNLQTEIETKLEVKIYKCDFYACLSDKIKHSLETFKPGSF